MTVLRLSRSLGMRSNAHPTRYQGIQPERGTTLEDYRRASFFSRPLLPATQCLQPEQRTPARRRDLSLPLAGPSGQCVYCVRFEGNPLQRQYLQAPRLKR